MDKTTQALNPRKTEFLDGVQRKVNNYILSTGSNCIAVVEKSSDGGILCTYECHMDKLSDFCKVLYKFVRKKQHRNHDLDSALTQPISDIVETAYQTSTRVRAILSLQAC
jgi:hypothetical protein